MLLNLRRIVVSTILVLIFLRTKTLSIDLVVHCHVCIYFIKEIGIELEFKSIIYIILIGFLPRLLVIQSGFFPWIVYGLGWISRVNYIARRKLLVILIIVLHFIVTNTLGCMECWLISVNLSKVLMVIHFVIYTRRSSLHKLVGLKVPQ